VQRAPANAEALGAAGAGQTVSRRPATKGQATQADAPFQRPPEVLAGEAAAALRLVDGALRLPDLLYSC
jgi:hypothetical protein